MENKNFYTAQGVVEVKRLKSLKGIEGVLVPDDYMEDAEEYSVLEYVQGEISPTFKLDFEKQLYLIGLRHQIQRFGFENETHEFIFARDIIGFIQ